MTTINESYINALLADASYVPLTLDGDILNTGQLMTLLGSRLTNPQAEFVLSNFQVVNQELSTNDGFDAVVWRGKQATEFAGKIYISFRGTQGIQDIADDKDLSISGLAHAQLTNMVNWWLRETTQKGGVAQQIGIQKLAFPGFPASIQNFVAAESAIGTGRLSDITSIESVNGHSLGGYLASSFVRLFGEQWPVANVSTFNSAGFSRPATFNIDHGFNQITAILGTGTGSVFAENAQLNFFAENGINVTTNTWKPIGFRQIGTRIPIFQEDGAGFPPISNHYMYKLTDVLALGAALEKLDPSMNIDCLNRIAQAGSNVMQGSYEGALDSMRRMIFGPNITPTLTSDASNGNDPQPQERIDFHEKLKELTADGIFASLADLGQQGKISIQIVDGRDLASLAKTNFGAMLSLNALSTVAILSPDSDVAEVLKLANPVLAEHWEMDSASRATGEEPQYFSDKWFNDRAEFLSKIVDFNDRDDGLDRPIGVRYEDRGQSVALGASGTLTRRITFGSEGSDTIVGSIRNDDLLGAGGDDSIQSGAGDDYIEGGAGNDLITAGDGADTIFGGLGDDTIAGEFGNDRISGCAGWDTYIYNAGDGADTITDSDGQGQIRFNGSVLSGGSKSAGSGFESDDGQFHYSFVGNLASGGTLLINGQLVVTNFHNGDLDISLGSHSPDEGNPTDQYQYLGGVDTDGVLRGVYPTTYEPSGNWQVDQQFIDGSDLDDHYIAALVDDSGDGAPPVLGGAVGLMDGKAGNDLFEGAFYFSDESYGGPGNDVLFGAAVGDSLDPPADPVDGDILGGNAGQDEITGGIFDDFLYGDESIFFADNFEEGHYRYVFSNGMIIDSNESTGDVRVELLGENAAGPWPRAFETARDAFDYVLGITEETDLDTLYDDVVDGIDGNDEIVGGNGSDTLIGGDGNDLITGDYDASFYLGPDARQAGFGEYSYLLGKPGDDYLDGGDGDDILSDELGGSDQLFGGDGDDILINIDGEPLPQFYSEGEIPEAVAYINLLDGGIGNDQIHSTSAHPGSYDLIFGGEGDDVVDFIGYSAQIDLGEGSDVLHADANLTGSFLTVFGGDGDDQLTIDYADDIDVSGGAGDDTISAAGRRIRVDQTGANPGDFDSLNLSFASTFVAVERDRGDLVLTNLSGDESIVTLVSWFEAGAHQLDEIAFADGITWSPVGVAVALLKDHTAGSAGNDVLFSNGRDSQMRGLNGDDVLVGRDSGMLLDGGMGNDDIRLPDSNQGFVVGGRGDDVLTGSGVFAYNRGDGRDTLVNFSGTISLGGISYENVSMTTDNGGLNLDFGLGDSISLIDPRYLFVNPGAGSGPEPLLLQIVSPTRIAIYDLAHGGEPIQTSLDSAIGGNLAYQYAITGTTNSSSDAISSTALDEINLGSSLQDLRLGRSLNEILFELGEGSRAVAAQEGVDTIRFGPGIGPDNLKLGLGSLAISVGDFGDVLHLGNFDPADVHGPRDFGNFRFEDGSLLTYEQLVSKGFDIDGTDGDDVITGTNTTDRIDGRGGNDLLSGGYGSDTYFFGAGYGHDEIVEAASTYDQDVVRIRTRSDQVTVERDNNDIVIRLADSNDSLALKSWYAASSARIESVQFDDGAIWDGANLESRAKDAGATELMLNAQDPKDSTISDFFVRNVAEDNSAPLASPVDAMVTATEEGGGTATDEGGGVAISSGEEKSVDLPLVAGGADSSHRGHDVAQIDTPLDGLDLGFRPALASGPANEISTSPQAGNSTSRGAGVEAYQSFQDWYADGDSIGDIQLSFESPAVANDPAEISNNPSIQTVQTGRPGQGIDAEDTPGLSNWSIGYALMEMHLAKSDDAALGMEVGHFNGLNGALTGIGLEAAQSMIGAARFGSDAQSMQMLSGLTEGLAVLS